MALASRIRRTPAAQAGFTLVELLVATAMSMVVFGTALSLLIVALHQQASSSNRADAVDTAQVALAQMTKDLRQACATAGSSVAVGGGTASAGTRLAFTVGSDSGDCSANTTAIVWDCGGGTCVRTAGGQSRVYVTGVTSNPVFTCQSPPGTAAACGQSTTFVQIQLAVSVGCAREGRGSCPSSRTVQVSDGVSLRNA